MCKIVIGIHLVKIFLADSGQRITSPIGVPILAALIGTTGSSQRGIYDCQLLLGELKKAKSFAVQGQLIMAIGTIGDHTAIDPLVNILDDRSQPLATRAMAAVGLGMIGDLRPLSPLARISKNYNYRASVSDLDELLFIL